VLFELRDGGQDLLLALRIDELGRGRAIGEVRDQRGRLRRSGRRRGRRWQRRAGARSGLRTGARRVQHRDEQERDTHVGAHSVGDTTSHWGRTRVDAVIIDRRTRRAGSAAANRRCRLR
jgi:hypothetical protein